MDKRVIALGFFDGVHRGHGALLRAVAAHARELNASPAALLFEEHPQKVIGG
ncbi:MAG: riboflavin biosynthesis protein RibF, partial [Clostridia bacterium]